MNSPTTLNSLPFSAHSFAFDVQKQISKPETNVFFSPASIYIAIGMIYVGADGSTKSQIRRKLFGDSRSDEEEPEIIDHLRNLNGLLDQTPRQKWTDVVLKSANRVYLSNDVQLKSSYSQKLIGDFRSEVQKVDFKTRTESTRTAINDWVSLVTKNRINDLVPPGALSPDTLLVLVNALYFKGSWTKKFYDLSDKPFHTNPGKNAQLSTMSQTDSFYYAENDLVKVLEMKYKGDDVSMVVVLPKERFGLTGLLRNFDGRKFGTILKSLKNEKVQVQLPKFKFDQSFRLKDALTKVGITEAFGSLADFSGIADRRIAVGEVLHKAFIEVNENGTEAAAATALLMVGAGAPAVPVEPKSFIADHPFLFAIVAGTDKNILFLGQFYGQ